MNTVRGLLVDAEARRPVLGQRRRRAVGCGDQADRAARGPRRHRAHPGLPIVGTGGVTTGIDAVEMLLAGASAVGVGTATFAEPRAALRILDELCTWCERHGVHAVRELTGAMREPDTRPLDTALDTRASTWSCIVSASATASSSRSTSAVSPPHSSSPRGSRRGSRP